MTDTRVVATPGGQVAGVRPRWWWTSHLAWPLTPAALVGGRVATAGALLAVAIGATLAAAVATDVAASRRDGGHR